jgi:hypothetical protein
MHRCTLCQLMVNRTASERPHPALRAASTFWTTKAGQLETYVCSTCGSEWQRLAPLPGVGERHWLAISAGRAPA